MDAPPAAGDGSAAPSGPSGGGAADLGWRIAGALVGMAGGLLTGLLEVFLTPLRVAGIRTPVSIVLAVLTNLLLVWYTYRATSHRGAALLPGLVWFAVMVRASGRTTEGDLLLTGDNWVGLATIFAGTVAFAAGAYRVIVPRAVSQP